MASYCAIVKDLQGYRLVNALSYDSRSHIFTLDNGELMSGEIWLATPQNVNAMINGYPMQKVSGSMYWPIPVTKIAEYISDLGWGADKNLRLRPKLGAPFMQIKPINIPMIIMLHEKTCAEAKKEPEREPILITWHEDNICMVVKKPDMKSMKVAMVQLPAITPEGMERVEPGKVCKFNNQIALCWGDYSLIPKTSDVLTLHKHLKVEELAESLGELEKQRIFLSKDGLICYDGTGTLAASGLSIDMFK